MMVHVYLDDLVGKTIESVETLSSYDIEIRTTDGARYLLGEEGTFQQYEAEDE